MTQLHIPLCLELAKNENPTARELNEASRLLGQMAHLAYLEQFGHADEAAEMRRKMEEG